MPRHLIELPLSMPIVGSSTALIHASHTSYLPPKPNVGSRFTKGRVTKLSRIGWSTVMMWVLITSRRMWCREEIRLIGSGMVSADIIDCVREAA
jgi:hypothetical protein